MSWKGLQFSILAALNHYLPVVGFCVPGPCPAIPTRDEIVWWHLVTALLMLGAALNMWIEVRDWPHNRAHRYRGPQGPDPPKFY